MADGLTLRLVEAASAVSVADWDRCAATLNPFASRAFFTSLEDSGSATADAGWQPVHLLAENDAGVQGVMPGYVKTHSQGEYVFDHGWADAYARAGLRYYPKYQHATPFTPATAPKILTQRADVRAALIQTSEALVAENGLSSAHATFLEDADLQGFGAQNWLERHDIQYHWHNQGWSGFDDFLGALSARKRKNLRKEREAALGAVDGIDWLTGADLNEAAWDAFYEFYIDTSSRKWGRPYLTRAFFSLIGERMPDQILLMMARKSGRYVAGALNFIGSDTLYGRQWGCTEDIPFLHFELCYHQAIDAACQRGLSRVEAGAQGGHKLARGYQPMLTRSMHYIHDPRFRTAVADYLERERAAYAAELAEQRRQLPFKSMI